MCNKEFVFIIYKLFISKFIVNKKKIDNPLKT